MPLFYFYLSISILHRFLCSYFSNYLFSTLIIIMVDSTDFSHYHLTGWNIDDDSLSYIDHDYWEGVLNQIVESEMGRKLSDLDRDKLFHKGFGLINNPPHGDRSGLRRYSKYSESRRFKFVIKCLWDITGMMQSFFDRCSKG